jgi:hypothetical protein
VPPAIGIAQAQVPYLNNPLPMQKKEEEKNKKKITSQHETGSPAVEQPTTQGQRNHALHSHNQATKA